MKTKTKSFGIVAGFLLLMALLLATPASAATYTFDAYNPNGYRWVTINGEDHAVVSYTIPHGTLVFPLHIEDSQPCGYPCWRPSIKGLDYYVVANMGSHTDPTKWDYYKRTKINTYWDKLELLVPRRYVYTERLINPCWTCDIYLGSADFLPKSHLVI